MTTSNRLSSSEHFLIIVVKISYLFKFLLILWILHHGPNPIHLLIRQYQPSACNLSPKTNQTTNKQKPNKQTIQPWRLWYVTVSYSVPFVHTTLLAKVHCSESLVWFEDSGFGYSVSTGSSQGNLSDILLLPRVMQILQLWFFSSEFSEKSRKIT